MSKGRGELQRNQWRIEAGFLMEAFDGTRNLAIKRVIF